MGQTPDKREKMFKKIFPLFSLD